MTTALLPYFFVALVLTLDVYAVGPTEATVQASLTLVLNNGTEYEDYTEEEIRQQATELWTRYFFDFPRRPRNGSVTFVFPGLFDNDVESERVGQLTGPRSSRSELTSPAPRPNPENVSQFYFLSNDSRWYEHGMEVYHFHDVELLEEEQRQRRRLLSARRQVNLLHVDHDHVSTMINTVFSSPRDFATSQPVRSSVVRYLTTKMRSLGLVTGNQLFEPTEFGELFESFIPNGTNVVGILPGDLWGTKEDEILVIGAHWDTIPHSSGMDDNGSGVTALLEVARAMTEASCRPRHSVVFVAFDLEEVGCLGSMYFVRDFLVPHVLKAHGGARLKGAFILDTIMNFNESEFSQILSDEWRNRLPDFYADLSTTNFTGNFLTALYRKDVDSVLATTLADSWRDAPVFPEKTPKRPPRSQFNRNRFNNIEKSDEIKSVVTVKSRDKFDLKNVRLDLEADVTASKLSAWTDLLRSDHSRFWYHNVDYPTSFPAVLITDTGPYRGMMQECYHKECDSAEANRHLKFASVKFLAKTSQALIDTLVTLSQSQCLVQDNVKAQRWTSAANESASGHQLSSASVILAASLVVFRWICSQ